MARKVAQVRMGTSNVILVAPLAGDIAIAAGASRLSAQPGAAMLVARHEQVLVTGEAGARALVVHLQRHQLHRLASEAHGDGRRVSTARLWSLPMPEASPLAGALAEVEQLINSVVGRIGPEAGCVSDRLHRSVLRALTDCAPVDAVLPLSRAVTDAIRRVHTRPDDGWDLERLAAAASVTPKYLQQSFHDHLGKGVGAFVLETRLRHARESLSTARDSRPLSAIAASLGFQRAGSFTRAYIRLFGEPPSETRARAVRASG